jgi:O-antigen/teichoic acid export membrane protein
VNARGANVATLITLRPLAALRRLPLPQGTLTVGSALLVAGIATYAFFRVGQSTLGGPEQFAPISALWFATFSLAPGVFLPLEQELGRALAHRRARGLGGAPVVARVIQLSAIMIAVVLGIIALGSPLIARTYFGGDWLMLAALATAFVAYAPAHLARGICAGTGRFNGYALVLGSDGVIRILLVLGLAAVGITAAAAFGFAVALAPLAAVAYLALRGRLHTEPGPPAPWQEVTPNLGWLLIGSVSAAALLNAGVVTANLLAAEDQKFLVTQFAFGVLLARVPLFLFQAVQAALLPRLTGLAARGEFAEFRSGFARLMGLVTVVGVSSTAAAFLLGPWAIELIYEARLDAVTLALLALASAIYMLALATAQAVIALRGHILVAAGWSISLTVFVITVTLVEADLFRRIEYALLAASATALIGFGWALRSRLSRQAAVPIWPTPEPDHLPPSS